MALSDTLASERLAGQYFLTRLSAAGRAQQLGAAEQFDLARSPLSDDELEDIVDSFRDSPAPRNGWGLAEGLEAVLSRDPKKIPVSDLEALQKNLVARGYAPPNAQPNGVWDTSWYAAFRRFDRDNFEAQRQGKHWYSTPVSSGINALSNTLPSRVFQGIVGGAKGVVLQTPETLERGGLVGGAVAGGAIGAAVGSAIPGPGTLIGAGVGAAIGGAAGFLADLFGEDESEPEDQSFLSNFVDALSPWTEYQQNPKAVFEDLGYVLSATSYIAGAGVAGRGIATGVRTLQAARATTPTIATEAAALAPGATPGITPAVAPSVTPGITPGFATQSMPLVKAALMRPPGANQLGVFGTVVRAATRKVAPGSVGALEKTMLKYSGFTFGQRLGPNIALKAFGGASQAAMGPRLFGGLGAGSRERTAEAKAALEAELGRSLTLQEVRELEERTAQTTIEKALTSAPELKTGVELPFIGDMVDLAAFVLYPQRLIPFRGAGVRSATEGALNAPLRSLLTPKTAAEAARRASESSALLISYAHAVQHQNPGMGIRKAIEKVKGYITPVDNAWLRADYGIHREATTVLQRAFRDNFEKAYRAGGLANARADIVRTIRQEFDRNGSSPLLEKIMRYSMDTVDGLDGPTDFGAWLIQLNGKHRGLDRLAAWKEANKLARKAERELNAPINDPNFRLTAEGTIARLPTPQGRSVRTGSPVTNVQRMALKDRIELLSRRAKLYEARADRGALDPFTSIQLREQARLARAEVRTLEDTLAVIRAQTTDKITKRMVITPGRVDFADQSVLYGKAQEFQRLRRDVLNTVESGNVAAEPMARQKLANFVDELAMDGHIPDKLARQAKVGKPSDRIARYLELNAKSAAKPVDLSPGLAAQFDELGYKPLITGDDVIFPDQLEQMIEVTGVGDLTRRAAIWETIGASPRWRSDRALFRVRRESELAELENVFARNGIKLSGEQGMRHLYERLRAVNHDGAALGPFIRSEGKTRLYKVDARDLSPDDILKAFDDVPGVTDEVARDIYGALRRGAAYGAEATVRHPVQTMKAIGTAMRLNGLPGFSDVIRTAHTDVPSVMKRSTIARGHYTYKPPAHPDSALDLAHSAERARIEVGLKQVADKANVTENQRQFGMAMLDSLAQGQVRAGRFASVDDFFRHMDVGYAEKYVGDLQGALFKRVSVAPEHSELRELAAAYEDSKLWYESSARTLAAAVPPGKVQLFDGSYVENYDLFAQVLAVTSPLSDPGDNLGNALRVMEAFFRGDNPAEATGLLPSMTKMVDDIFQGKSPDRWEQPFRTTKKGLPASSRSRLKVFNFYKNLMGEADNVTVDTWMARLYGLEGGPTAAEYDEIAASIRSLAGDLGWKPMQVQAALWRAVKESTADSYLREAMNATGKDAATFRRVAAQVRDSRSFDDYIKLPQTRERFEALNWNALLQRVEDDVLGATQFGPDFTATMRFFRNADFSTLAHENAHLLRRLLSDEDVATLERAYGLRDAAEVTVGPPAKVISTRTKSFRDSAQAMFRRSHSEADGNGFTWDPHTGSFRDVGVPGAGTSVAVGDETALLIRPTDKAFNDADAFRAEIRKFMGQHSDELENSRMHVGGWKDDEGIHIDVSEILASRDEAQRIGVLRKQKAVFDLETFEELPATLWTRSAEERFAEDIEELVLRKVQPGHSKGTLTALREALGSLWGSTRPYWQETNAVPRSVRRVFDKAFDDVLRPLPDARPRAALKAVGSKQAIGGAVLGGAMGATQGEDFEDVLRGVALGAAGGLATRSALKRTYGYLPDYLTRLNTALRYTLSFTFDAGRFTEQNMIAMTKHGLPPMLSPTKYVKAQEWKSPFTRGKVHGDTAWKDAVRFWDELNGTSWFQNIDDLDRRLFQAGMLGFSPRNWEVAQAWQLYQRGMGTEQIREAVSQIGRYGIGRTAAEKSANFIVFPFSFSKKLITTLGDFFLQAPARNLLLHETYRRYHESEFDDKVSDFLDRHVPLLKELAKINNLAYGISPGRFFLQGLSDQRTDVGKVMQILASVFVPSGAATPLAQAAGGVGDLAVHAFTPIVLTGESINRGGGMDPVMEIMRRYVPFIRELDQYFLSDNAAVREQLTATTEGAAPYYQFQKYQDELKEAKAPYEALAPVLGYQGLDGLLQSDMGAGIGAQIDATRNQLAEKYPTGFAMSQTFSNSDAVDERAILDIAEKEADGRASEAERRILELKELEQSFANMKAFLDPQLVDSMAAKVLRDKAVAYSDDRRFVELYDRFFLYTYGPIRRIA